MATGGVSAVITRGRLGVAMLACLVVAGCGGGSAPGTRISGTPVAPAGFTTYQGPAYQLSVPAGQRPFVTRSATGRTSAAWSTPGTGNFSILATYDPHPVSFATAVATATHASQTAFAATRHDVVSAKVAGARAAKLITASGTHGAGPYHGLPQRTAELLVSTKDGATIDVLIASHGSGNPDPVAVADSFRLAK
jgi:hypothetical protein